MIKVWWWIIALAMRFIGSQWFLWAVPLKLISIPCSLLSISREFKSTCKQLKVSLSLMIFSPTCEDDDDEFIISNCEC